MELESETYIQTQTAARLSLPDPLLISSCSSTSFILPAVHLSVCQSPSVQHSLLSLHVFHSLLFLFFVSSSPPSLSLPPRPPLSLAHECSDGLFQLYLFKLQQNMSFWPSGSLPREQSAASSVYSNFTLSCRRYLYFLNNNLIICFVFFFFLSFSGHYCLIFLFLAAFMNVISHKIKTVVV